TPISSLFRAVHCDSISTTPSIAAKHHKVQTACLLEALEAPRHDCIVTPEPGLRRPQSLKFLIVLPQLGKSKSPPLRRHSGQALSQKTRQERGTRGVRMVEKVGQPQAPITEVIPRAPA